jgi:hypothetical protein
LTPNAGDNAADTVKRYGTKSCCLAKPELSCEWDHNVVTGFSGVPPVFKNPRLQKPVLWRPASHIPKLVEQMEEGRKPSFRTFSLLISSPKTQ